MLIPTDKRIGTLQSIACAGAVLEYSSAAFAFGFRCAPSLSTRQVTSVWQPYSSILPTHFQDTCRAKAKSVFKPSVAEECEVLVIVPGRPAI